MFGRRIAVTAAFTVGALVVGVAFASWVVNGSGDGYSKAIKAGDLYTNDAGASTTSQLYPGASGDVKLTIRNPNPLPVKIAKIEADGAVSSDKAGCTDVGDDVLKATGVTFATVQDFDPSTLGNQPATAPAKASGTDGSLDLSLAGAASMSNASVNACQEATFTIPVKFTAGS